MHTHIYMCVCLCVCLYIYNYSVTPAGRRPRARSSTTGAHCARAGARARGGPRRVAQEGQRTRPDRRLRAALGAGAREQQPRLQRL